MWCKVVIFHHEWKRVIVNSIEMNDWLPSGFDVNAGIGNVEKWRQELDEPIPSIKSFDDNGVNREKLNDQLICNIKGKFTGEWSCNRQNLNLRNRYIIVLSDEIYVEYDDGAFDGSIEPKHKFTVLITPNQES